MFKLSNKKNNFQLHTYLGACRSSGLNFLGSLALSPILPAFKLYFKLYIMASQVLTLEEGSGDKNSSCPLVIMGKI